MILICCPLYGTNWRTLKTAKFKVRVKRVKGSIAVESDKADELAKQGTEEDGADMEEWWPQT